MSSSCCGPQMIGADLSAGDLARQQKDPENTAAPRKMTSLIDSFVWCDIPEGSFTMGSEGPDAVEGDAEGPLRRVFLQGFRISATTVSNADFAAFVRDTQYITEAERAASSFVFYLQIPKTQRQRYRQFVSGLPWWLAVSNASWQRPEGPHTRIHNRQDHPVVHVSWNDAIAYCAWAGVNLPTEAQWERAARGGLEGKRFAWGDDLLDANGIPRCNVFRGLFPDQPAHGWQPEPISVYAGEANGFGLLNVCGNVWEWCSQTAACDLQPLRGGSFLCHDSYCNRYRVSARTFNSPSTAASNIGFRIVN